MSFVVRIDHTLSPERQTIATLTDRHRCRLEMEETHQSWKVIRVPEMVIDANPTRNHLIEMSLFDSFMNGRDNKKKHCRRDLEAGLAEALLRVPAMLSSW